MPASIQIENAAHTERHYAVAEIAVLWNLSADKFRELFAQEPGVLVIGDRNPRCKMTLSHVENSTNGCRSRTYAPIIERCSKELRKC
jgi:hypothetical protein